MATTWVQIDGRDVAIEVHVPHHTFLTVWFGTNSFANLSSAEAVKLRDDLSQAITELARRAGLAVQSATETRDAIDKARQA